MEIAATARKEKTANSGEYWIAKVTMEGGHGAGSDPSLEAVAHDQVIAGPEPVDEGFDREKVVAVVSVAHDDKRSSGARNAPHQGAPVALGLHMNDASAHFGRNGLRSIGAAVVGNDHLADDPMLGESGLSLLDANAKRFGLVEARHHER